MLCYSFGGSGSRSYREPRRLWPYADGIMPLLPTDTDPDTSLYLEPPRHRFPFGFRSRRTNEPTRGLQPERHNPDRPTACPSSPGRQVQTIAGRQTCSRPKPTCLICLETPEHTNTWAMPSAHCTHGLVACKTCVREYIVHKITVEGSATLICPHLGCRRVLEYKDVVKRIQDDTACLDRYNALVGQADLEKHPNFVWCMNSLCGRGQIHKEGAAVPVVICEHCYTRSCFKHRVLWHSGLTCEQYESCTKYKQENRASEEYIAKHAKRCPNLSCRRPILKIDGCDHMTCRRPGGCGHEFCWACLADYGPIRRLGNHLHGPSCPHYSGPLGQAPIRGNIAPQDNPPFQDDLLLQEILLLRDNEPPETTVTPPPITVHYPVPRSYVPPAPVLSRVRPQPQPRPSPTGSVPGNVPPAPVLSPLRPRRMVQPNVNPSPPRRPSPPPAPPAPGSPVNVPVIPDPVPVPLSAPAPPVATQPPRRQMRQALVSIRKETSSFGEVQEVLSVISSAAWWPVVYLLLVFVGLILRIGETKVVSRY
ncbi:hypothetical protein B0J17DRAFT_645191 [Rhizoctonia solani]|nr:hypothetical protein B0J17DRAFT_645191 [Rhizoctonia solani]